MELQGPLSLYESRELELLLELLEPIRPIIVAIVLIRIVTDNRNSSVSSFYKFINHGGILRPFSKAIWKAVALGKIKIFLWLAVKNKLHTKDMLAKKGWEQAQVILYASQILKLSRT